MTKPLLSLAAFAARVLPASWKQAIYRIRPLAGPLRRALNRAVPVGLTPVEVAGGDLSGFRLLLDLQSEKDYWLGTYEPELQAALRERVRPGMVAYDVGANIGYVTLLLARRVGETGKVFAFEALPANLERLAGNLALNRLEGRVTVFAGAVAQAAGPVRFLVHASGGMGKAVGSVGRQETAYPSEISVEGISLDEYVYGWGNPAPQVVKMDIEGGEVMALPGMQRLLAEACPLLLLELHGPESARAAWEALTRAGYRLCRMKRGCPPVDSPQALDWKAYIVALPSSPPPSGEG